MKTSPYFVLVVVLVSALLFQTPASAAAKIGSDVESDPIAFALGGYSLHTGVTAGRWRVDAGAFAMQFPEALHGNANLNVGFHGFGLKLQYFLFDDQAGAFLGAGAGLNEMQVQHRRTRLAATRTQFGAGVQTGWRFALPAGFYVTPWIGLDYAPTAEPVAVSGETFENGKWSVFPTVHLGYRF